MKPTNQQRSPLAKAYSRTLSKRLFILSAILVALLVSLPAAAQENVEIRATLSAPDSALTVGDPIALTLSVIHPQGYQVIAPEIERDWGSFVVHGVSAPQTIDNGDGTATTNLIIDARLFAPGTSTTLPLNVKLADNTGQVVSVMAEPLSVEISSVLVEGDTELRDIKPQAQLPYVNWMPWLIIGLSVIGAAVIIILAVRRSRALRALAAADNRLPHEVALDELAHIEGLRLPEQARFKEHYSMVSDCLRLYMERRVHVPMMERTTAEIEAGLGETWLPKPVAAQYIALLDASDLVKFAKLRPAAANAYAVLQSARQIVNNTRPTDELDPAVEDSPSRPTPTSGTNISKNGTYKQMEVGA